MKLDSNQEPIVTGTVFNDSTNSYDVFTVKYNTSGVEQWYELYNGTANDDDSAGRITIDQNDDIYIIGGVANTNNQIDALTIKYNSSGVEQWANTYDNAGLDDGATSIRDYGSYIKVIGITETSSNNYEQVTLEYNSTSGSLISSSISSGMSVLIQEVNDVILDDIGNVYITGGALTSGQGFDYKTIKLDETSDIVWTATFNSPNSGEDIAQALTLDAAGNVYVTGYSTLATGRKTTTIKYSSTGTQLWATTDTETGEHEGKDISITSNDEVFVTGYRQKENGNQDFSLIEYDSSGVEQWATIFNGIYNEDDKASLINLDGEGDVLISGASQTKTGSNTFLTVKYNRAELIIPPDDEPMSSAFNYIENKGQLLNTDDTTANDVIFYTNDQSTGLYFQNDRVSMVTASIDTSATTQDTLHRVDMIFNTRNYWQSKMRVSPLEKRSDYFNYYLGHIQEGREKVRLFDQLVYSQIYDGIDALYSSNSAGLKYYFVCHPGANPNDIQLTFEGQNNLSVVNGDLVIGTSLGNIVLPEPKAFKILNGAMVEYGWTPTYSVSGNVVTIGSGSFDGGKPLVFQVFNSSFSPTNFSPENLDWSTYIGGVQTDIINDISQGDDDLGSYICVTGFTRSKPFPVLLGEFIDPNWDTEAIVGRFSIDGVRKWMTYFGGGSSSSNGATDEGDVITTDNNGNIYFCGASTSTDLPIFGPTNSDYDDNHDFESLKAFITKLGAHNGFRKWATFFGGEGHQTSQIMGVDINSIGNIVIGGKIRRSSIGQNPSFPIVGDNSGYYTKSSDTKGSAFICELTPDLNIVWSTLLGADNGGWATNGSTNVFDLTIDKDDNVILVGSRHGSDLTGHEFANAQWNTVQGETDGFIMKFDFPARIPVWSTLFGGSMDDYIHGVAFDTDDNIYVIGETESSTSQNFPIKSFNSSNSSILNDNTRNGFTDLFFAKFLKDGTQVWTSYFGGEKRESNGNVSVDTDDNVFFTGTSRSSDLGLLNLTNAYYQPLLNQPNYTGMSTTSIDDETDDSFIFALNGLLEKQWITFIGGHSSESIYGDKIKGIVSYLNDYLFFVGGSSSNSSIPFPTQDLGNDAFFQENNTGDIDGIIGRFSIEGLFNISTNLNVWIQEKFEFKITPNPVNNFFAISYDNQTSFKFGDIKIIDVHGKCLYNKKIKNQKNIKERIDVSNFPKGIYFVQVSIENKISVRKVIIQ